uniref:Pumilio RNA-binding family member 3 n=1 Tax=Haplochromis burtoni TaxID=8153 RepID=A0A3Q2VIL7_HAPBU
MLIFLLLSHFFSQTDIRMETQSKKNFSPRNGKKFMQKGKGTKFGGKPGSKKPFKQYNNAERKSRPGKGRDGDKRQTKSGPGAKKVKKDGFKPNEKLTKEELKKNSRQEAVICIAAVGSVLDVCVNRKNCEKDLKKKLLRELRDLIHGKVKQMAFAHDAVRVLQCYIQFSNHEQRQEVFEELKDDILSLSKSQYGRHVVKKLLMYGNKELVAAVINRFKGHVRQMLRHAAASSIIEYAYNDKAVLAQRLMLTDELYGNTYTVCKSYEFNTLEKVVRTNPDKLNNIMDEMKQILTPMAQKEQVIKHSLVHKVFLDFFQCAPEKQRTEMIESIRQSVVYMAHTHDGARVAMNSLWHGTAKVRTRSNATTARAHAGVLLLQTILESLDEVIGNKYGKKVLVYLLSPRDPAHLVPEIIKVLEKGDGNAHSKKDTATRRKELLEVVSPPLLEYLCNNAAAMAMDKATSVTISDILASACGDLRPAMTAVAQLANQELVPGGIKGKLHMAEHPAGHLVLKWLIEQDVTLAEAEQFGRILVDTVGTNKMKSWAKVNRGAMVLCSLLNSCDKSVAAEVKAALESIRSELSSISNNKGVEILLENLNK